MQNPWTVEDTNTPNASWRVVDNTEVTGAGYELFPEMPDGVKPTGGYIGTGNYQGNWGVESVNSAVYKKYMISGGLWDSGVDAQKCAPTSIAKVFTAPKGGAVTVSADTVLRIPSGSDKEEQIRAMALKAYTACDCRGLARVDFMVDASGEIFINEINTMPGFTSGSMYAKLFGASGVDYSDLVEMLLEFAVEDMAEREISI